MGCSQICVQQCRSILPGWTPVGSAGRQHALFMLTWALYESIFTSVVIVAVAAAPAANATTAASRNTATFVLACAEASHCPPEDQADSQLPEASRANADGPHKCAPWKRCGVPAIDEAHLTASTATVVHVKILRRQCDRHAEAEQPNARCKCMQLQPHNAASDAPVSLKRTLRFVGATDHDGRNPPPDCRAFRVTMLSSLK